MIDLYYWTTPNGHKITMFLEETGMPYRIVPVNIGRGEQFKPEFLKIAPNNRIPAIVDNEPVEGAPLSLFESGAILLYLAEKSKQLIPSDLRGRATTLEWLFWQVAGLGPMAGQTHHFLNYAPEKIQYAMDRYVKETSRLYAVLDRHLEGREFIAGAYSIADIACYPWIVPWNLQNQNMDEHPNLKRWLAAIKERPATVRAYARAQEVNPTQKPMDDEAKKLLFGQDASTVRAKT
jgi:GST-like protein